MTTHIIASVLAANGVWSNLMDVNASYLEGNLGSLQSMAVILAAMLAALSIIKTTNDYVQGEMHFGWQLLRPLLILFCVMEFSMVCRAFDGVVNIFTRDIAECSGGSISELTSTIGDAFSSLKAEQQKITEATERLAEQESWGFWKKLWQGIRIAAQSFTKGAELSLLTALTFCGKIVTEMIFFVFEMLAALYLALMQLGGPFIIALTIPEGWKSGLAGWMARYIQISLWVPLGFVVMGLLNGYFERICGMLVKGGLDAGIFVIGIGLIAVTIAGIMAIPKLASWWINSAGSGNAQSGFEKSMQSIGRRMFK